MSNVDKQRITAVRTLVGVMRASVYCWLGRSVVIWRSNGSVCGRRRSRSHVMIAVSSPTRRICHGWRLCGFGAMMARLKASRRTSMVVVSACAQTRSPRDGRRVAM